MAILVASELAERRCAILMIFHGSVMHNFRYPGKSRCLNIIKSKSYTKQISISFHLISLLHFQKTKGLALVFSTVAPANMQTPMRAQSLKFYSSPSPCFSVLLQQSSTNMP